MCVNPWVRVPVGAEGEHRRTRADCRTVLVTVPTVAAGTRLLDLAQFLHDDHRVHVLFTIPDTIESWHGTTEFLHDHGGLVIPWAQAVQQHFDLVLAASYTGLERIRGQVLVIPHGASSLMSRRFSRSGGPGALPHAGLSRETLTHRGRLIPSVVALTHDAELAWLRESCPEAVPHAVVAGDICFDRLLASRPLRDDYRRALGLRAGERLVTVSSTWSTESAFGQHPQLYRRLLDALPPRHRLAAVLHPSIWAVYGRWQVRSWLSSCVRDGLLVIPPEEGWRAAIVASDLVVGDHGSVTQYASALGKPVVLAAFPTHAVRPGSLADAVARVAPVLDLDRSLPAQLRRAVNHSAEGDTTVARMISSRPGGAGETLRRAMYDLLRLSEPEHPAIAAPVPAPQPLWPDLHAQRRLS
ncbi:MAG TPA: hypothetical protein VNP92_24045 [Actinophytocola sp.]|nr:hypothetical protein [Actinophytocola sp.]